MIAQANGVAPVDLDEYRDELKQAAADYIRAGLPITVCEGKNPGGVMGEGWHKQTVTANSAASMIDRASHPAIGIKQGMEGGILDFDVDSASELIAFMELFDQIPPVMPAYFSGREGGDHRLCASSEALNATGAACITFYTADRKHKVKARIGAGGSAAHSVAPPSLHCEKFSTNPDVWRFTGKRYEWKPGLSLEDVSPPPAPEAVVRKLLAAFHSKGKKSPRNGSASGVNPTALDAMRRCGGNMVDGVDGSKRLFAYSCRGVELNCSNAEIIATVRAMEAEKPFSRAWTDDEILVRVRDAENTVERGSEVVISNFSEVEIETPGLLSDGSAGEGETKTITVPKSMSELTGAIFEHSGGWPKRVDNMLFVDDPSHGMSYFDRRTTAGVFGWLRGKFKVDWAKGGRYAAQGEVFAELERTADRFDAVEVLPHEPTVAGIYYRGNRLQPGDGCRLRWLLNRFRPATTVDRDLIQAAIMTPLWGGAAGRRPAFVFTSDDGRGAGKTTVCEMIGRLYGGIIDVSAGEDIQTLKTRLLSPNSRTCRIGLIDNVKTMRLSWAELEALITSPVISGRQLFVGEGQRPNLLTWFLSLNGVSMATDMAQRSVIIKVVKGENAGDWHDVTTRYIDEHREQLIGDVIGALRADRFPLVSYSRWSTWESEVLCRLPEPGEAQRLILERQGEANCELEEGEIIEQYFAEQLASFGYEPNTAQVRIPTTSAAYWFTKAVGEPMKATAASRRLHQMAKEGQLKRIGEDTTRTYGRSFIWTGPAADVFGGPIDNNLASLIADRLERSH